MHLQHWQTPTPYDSSSLRNNLLCSLSKARLGLCPLANHSWLGGWTTWPHSVNSHRAMFCSPCRDTADFFAYSDWGSLQLAKQSVLPTEHRFWKRFLLSSWMEAFNKSNPARQPPQRSAGDCRFSSPQPSLLSTHSTQTSQGSVNGLQVLTGRWQDSTQHPKDNATTIWETGWNILYSWVWAAESKQCGDIKERKLALAFILPWGQGWCLVAPTLMLWPHEALSPKMTILSSYFKRIKEVVHRITIWLSKPRCA